MNKIQTRLVSIVVSLFCLAGIALAGSQQQTAVVVNSTNSQTGSVRIRGVLDNVIIKVAAGKFAVPSNVVTITTSLGDVLVSKTFSAAQAATVYPLRYRTYDSSLVGTTNAVWGAIGPDGMTNTLLGINYPMERKMIIDDVTITVTNPYVLGDNSTNTFWFNYVE